MIPLKHSYNTSGLKQNYSKVTVNDRFADVWNQLDFKMIMAGQRGPPLI